MARDNIISFARSFQEAFQRQQQIEIQRQREERFDRQLTANADFQQSQLNLQRQAQDLRERQFERGPSGSFGAVQLGGQTGVINRRTGELDVPIDPTTGAAFPSARVAGDTTTLPGKFALAAKLKQSGLTGTVINELTQNIPSDLNEESAEAFLRASDESVLPFFEQTTFGFGKTKFGAQPFVKNVSQKEAEGPFRKFLQDNNFASATPDQQEGILRAFDESLGLDLGESRAVPRDEIDFDLQSEFFQSIIKREGNPVGKIIERGGKQFKVTGHDKDGEPLVDEVK